MLTSVRFLERNDFMPLTFAEIGKDNTIKKISGNDEVIRHLKQLGFVTGASVKVVNEVLGNVIVEIKDSRIAINKGMANKIII